MDCLEVPFCRNRVRTGAEVRLRVWAHVNTAYVLRMSVTVVKTDMKRGVVVAQYSSSAHWRRDCMWAGLHGTVYAPWRQQRCDVVTS